MGWHYILTFKCEILPEYIPFIRAKYFQQFTDEGCFGEEDIVARDTAYTTVSKAYRDLIDIWQELDIGSHFQEYDLEGSTFTCRISKKVSWQSGCLREAYEKFMKDIIVPMTSEISECSIKSDDFGDAQWLYSDSDLRRVSFNLCDKIKFIEHKYNEDKTEILETRVVYKHSIKTKQYLDLDREYGRGR